MIALRPFQDFEALRRDLERSFERGSLLPSRFRHAFLPGRSPRHYPMVNLYDDGENFYVEGLAPGINPDEFNVSVMKNTLSITGNKPGLSDVSPDRVHRSERAAGQFARSVELPAEIDADKVEAEYRHGLLLLTLPRSESARPRRVQIKVS